MVAAKALPSVVNRSDKITGPSHHQTPVPECQEYADRSNGVQQPGMAQPDYKPTEERWCTSMTTQLTAAPQL